MTERLSETVNKTQEIEELIIKLEKVIDTILDIINDDFDEYDEDDLKRIIAVFTANIKKILST